MWEAKTRSNEPFIKNMLFVCIVSFLSKVQLKFQTISNKTKLNICVSGHHQCLKRTLYFSTLVSFRSNLLALNQLFWQISIHDTMVILDKVK